MFGGQHTWLHARMTGVPTLKEIPYGQWPEESKAKSRAAAKRWKQRNPEKCREIERARVRDPELQREYKRRSFRKKKALLQSYANALKNVPCVDCGETYHPVAMHFDHVRGEKVVSIAKLIARPCSLSMLQLEIEKCDIRCANCHAIRHFAHSTN